MSADTARLFFALWPPAGLAEELAGLARQLASERGGKASRPETIHLTLAFLGDLPVDRLGELKAAAASVRAPAFELRVDRLGYWPRKHLCWAGCAAQPALPALVDGLQRALTAAGFAVDGQNKAFVPHLTLLRKMPEMPASAALPVFSAWPCERFVLVRSQLSATGPAYQILGDFALHP